MKTDNWHDIDKLFHQALNLKGVERDAFLAGACSGDVTLRREIESLIGALESRDDFLEEPAFGLGMRILSDGSGESLTGRSIGPYRVLGALGRGGMGEVYLAEDPRIGRKVALKFLSKNLVDDNWAKRQFVKEAQAVALLDHQNICALYGMEEADGQFFIVMQYVDGRPLSELLREGALDQKTALDLAAQIAGALAEAHAHGIIHRDIKPQNIMVNGGGQVKVLDFGLAKLVHKQNLDGGGGDPGAETTQKGLILGTVGYMSPEQLRAERLDFRSDVFSCGVVLYEMLSGRNPFSRRCQADVISNILTGDPPSLKGVASGVSPELDRIVHRCLQKERGRRYPSASELLYELDDLRKGVTTAPRAGHPFSLRAAVLVLASLLAALSVFAYLRATRVRSIAVLPISNESPDKSIDYLGEGITESLINRLAPLSKLRVKSFTSVSGITGDRVDAQSAGRELNVDAVLVGKLIQREDSLVLQTKLVRTADGSQVWAGEYKIKLVEIFGLQEDIVKKVTDSLELWPGSESTSTAARGTTNPEAFRQYILGRFYWRNRSEENVRKAAEHFGEAVKLDPGYARAHAGLADCHALSSITAYGKRPTAEAMSDARAAALKALSLDPDLPEAHTSVGVVSLRYDWQWDEAERHFRRAIELDPDYAPAHYWYSNLMVISGRFNEAIAESEIAKNLDPFSRTSNMNYCRAFSFARRYGEASDCFNRVLKEYPDYEVAQYMLGFVYHLSGREREAIEIFERLYDTNKRLAASALGYAYGRAGMRAEARGILVEMEKLSGEQYLPPQEFAVVYTGLGDNDAAFKWLEEAYQERFASLTYLTADAAFDGLRRDPRFAALANRIKLPIQQ